MFIEKILFIVNPISEKRKGIDIHELVKKYLDHNRYSYTIEYSKYSDHAYEIACANRSRFHKIIAAGGDGTVNQVSKALLNTETQLGIIPLGSGNGLARALKIPVKSSKAVRHLNKAGTKKIDSGDINGHHFLNMAGIGFDAEIAHSFGLTGKRGLITYVKDVIKRFRYYIPLTFKFIEGINTLTISPFLISIANSSQYGNNAHISPHAKVDDGLLDICIMNKFPLWKSVFLAGRLFCKSMDKSKYLKILQKERLELYYRGELKGHVDGEPVFFKDTIRIQVKKNTISIIC